jgi:hypothetical protein
MRLIGSLITLVKYSLGLNRWLIPKERYCSQAKQKGSTSRDGLDML